MTQSRAADAASLHLPRRHDSDRVSFGDFVLHPAARMLYRCGITLTLGSRAMDLLIVLVGRAGQVVLHRELISRVWRGLVVEHGNIRVQIAGLRRALGDGEAGARYIANIPGQGYCFVAPIWRPVRSVGDPARHTVASAYFDQDSEFRVRAPGAGNLDDIARASIVAVGPL